jgi:hypothetical protein
MKTINLTVDIKNPEPDFKRIATELMNKWLLLAGDTQYRIAEIEFYLRDDQFHRDIYTHGHEIQKTSHRWYFHGSGIDITFGKGSYYGGILLRAIYDLKNDRYTYGPIQILSGIFSKFPGIHDTHLPFGLIPDESGLLAFEEPIAAPRIGLNAKLDINMCSKNYRFLIMAKRKHADKTGIVKAMEKQGLYSTRIKH